MFEILFVAVPTFVVSTVDFILILLVKSLSTLSYAVAPNSLYSLFKLTVILLAPNKVITGFVVSFSLCVFVLFSVPVSLLPYPVVV